MSRDYKKPAPRTSKAKNGKPMLTGILVGLFVGLAIALAVAIFVNSIPSPFVDKNKSADKPVHESKPPVKDTGNAEDAKDSKITDKPRFDFYTILPGSEEAVTDKQIKQTAQQTAPGNVKDTYFLQVSSFQKEADADNLKAKLALLGVEATIQTVTLPEKGIWHRVRVGPYTSIDELNRVRATLAQNGMEAALIKINDAAANPAKN